MVKSIPEFGATLDVIASRGEPTVLIVPVKIWRRLPKALRDRHDDVDVILHDGKLDARLVPLARFDAAFKAAIADAEDEILAAGAHDTWEREKAARSREQARRDAPVAKGIPAEVVKAELAGVHPIAAWRRHLGMTQVELAEAAGIGRAYLANLERDAKNGSVETLAKVARALGCLVEDLLPADS
jgi:DNA-binding XRE family transcriptional regulator/antitoxin (DNA-binding transcriptional repressor) of toxin-antitoxin stability system